MGSINSKLPTHIADGWTDIGKGHAYLSINKDDDDAEVIIASFLMLDDELSEDESFEDQREKARQRAKNRFAEDFPLAKCPDFIGSDPRKCLRPGCNADWLCHPAKHEFVVKRGSLICGMILCGRPEHVHLQ